MIHHIENSVKIDAVVPHFQFDFGYMGDGGPLYGDGAALEKVETKYSRHLLEEDFFAPNAPQSLRKNPERYPHAGHKKPATDTNKPASVPQAKQVQA